MGYFSKSVLVTLLTLSCFTSSVFTEQVNHVTQTPPPTPAAKAPVKPPVKPSVKPPAKAPVYPPAKSPAKPPVKPPVSPPTKPPVHPPVYPPKFNRSLVAVQGTVYCKKCTWAGQGHGTFSGAKPIKDALVRLVCKSSKKNITIETTTNENGYFLLLGPKTVSNYGYRICRTYLVTSKDHMCNTVTNFNGGEKGAVLTPVTSPGKSIVIVVNKLIYGLFNVGPFAFEPTCP